MVGNTYGGPVQRRTEPASSEWPVIHPEPGSFPLPGFGGEGGLNRIDLFGGGRPALSSPKRNKENRESRHGHLFQADLGNRAIDGRSISGQLQPNPMPGQ